MLLHRNIKSQCSLLSVRKKIKLTTVTVQTTWENKITDLEENGITTKASGGGQ